MSDTIKIEFPKNEVRRALSDLKEYKEEVTKELQGVVTRSTFRVGATARQLVPVKFGRLRGSITEKILKMQGIVAVNVDYAGAVEFGSKPHIIRPKRKKALAFKPAGGFRFWNESGRVVRKEVKHPGAKAQPFLRPAVKEEAPRFANAIKRILEDATKRDAK